MKVRALFQCPRSWFCPGIFFKSSADTKHLCTGTHILVLRDTIKYEYFSIGGYGKYWRAVCHVQREMCACVCACTCNMLLSSIVPSRLPCRCHCDDDDKKRCGNGTLMGWRPYRISRLFSSMLTFSSEMDSIEESPAGDPLETLYCCRAWVRGNNTIYLARDDWYFSREKKDLHAWMSFAWHEARHKLEWNLRHCLHEGR